MHRVTIKPISAQRGESPRPSRALAGLISVCLCLLAAPVQAAIFVVDSTTTGNTCTAAPADCSLTGAMALANAQPGSDTIHFDIPMSDPNCQPATGICRIILPSFAAVPAITDALIIDGYTQAGATPNTLPAPAANNAQLKIEVTSSEVGVQSSSWFNVSAVSLSIRGLALFPRGTILGGAGAATISVQGNWFNLTAAGTAPTHGTTSSPIILSNANRNIVIGGPTAADRNVIAGGGVDSSAPPLHGGGSLSLRVNSLQTGPGSMLVQGSLIGFAPDGLTAIPLRDAVTINVGDDGFTQPELRFVDNRLVRPLRSFGGSFGGGLLLQVSRVMTQPVLIQGNVFGLAVDGSLRGIEGDVIEVQLGNSSRVARATIGGLATGQGNVFAGALRQSLSELGSTVDLPVDAVNAFFEISGNQHLGNDGLVLDIPHTSSGGGVVRGRSPIDPGDADGGANRGQNPPQITSYAVAGNQLSLIYRVDALPANTVYPLRVDFYKALADEGMALIGSDSYTLADAGALKSAQLTVPAGVSLSGQDVVVGIATNAEAQSSEVSYTPITLEILSAEPSSCLSSDSLFCSGHETPPLSSLSVRVRASSTVFVPNGRVGVSGRSATCFIDLFPSAAPLQSEGRCILAGAGAPGSLTISAEYDTLSGAFGDPSTGSNVIQSQPFVVPAN